MKVTAKDNSAGVLKAMNQLTKSRVLVGVTQQKSSRKDEPINNAELTYILTNGSPLQHIPATPIIEPAIEAPDNKAAISREMQEGASSALDGHQMEFKKFMRRAGMTAQNAVKAWFVDPRNNWPENAPSTLRQKERAARKKMGKRIGPLEQTRRNIDTSALRNSMSYALEVDGKRERENE